MLADSILKALRFNLYNTSQESERRGALCDSGLSTVQTAPGFTKAEAEAAVTSAEGGRVLAAAMGRHVCLFRESSTWNHHHHGSLAANSSK